MIRARPTHPRRKNSHDVNDVSLTHEEHPLASLTCPGIKRDVPYPCQSAMANHVAIYAFAESLRTFLHDSHAAHKPGLPAATFEVLSSGRFSSTNETINDGTVTLYLHRVTHNNHLRNTRIGPPVGPLGLDLHFLLTVWGSKPDDEYTLLGWAMRELHYHAFLDASSLTTPTNAAQ